MRTLAYPRPTQRPIPRRYPPPYPRWPRDRIVFVQAPVAWGTNDAEPPPLAAEPDIAAAPDTAASDSVAPPPEADPPPSGAASQPASEVDWEGFAGEVAQPRPSPIPAAQLQWAQATPEQMAFMRRVYDMHVRRSAGTRAFVPDLDKSLQGNVEGVPMRREAAAALARLFAEAKVALARDRAAGNAQARAVTRIGISSGYRSASKQFSLWRQRFPRSYRDTTAKRAGLQGGPHGAAAAGYLARHIGAWLAAPGYSNHNRGLAADLSTTERGHTFGASSAPASLAGWRTTWLFKWLVGNAARFGFHQNTTINEPWHWEYRPASGAGGTNGATLKGEIAPATQVAATARHEVARVSLLDNAGGHPPALILRWNQVTASPTVVDIVVHFHGYARCGQPARIVLPRDVEPLSGLDFVNPEQPTSTAPRRMRPTLAVLPRGTLTGAESGRMYTFPTLITPTGLKELIDLALDQFARHVGAARPRPGRLILTAHSGGGAALLRALKYVNPSEVHLFDCLYGWPEQDYTTLARWVRARIRRDQAALAKLPAVEANKYMRTQGGALRCVFGPTTSKRSLALSRLLDAALASAPGPGLRAWYRVEPTSLKHCAIPRRIGWQLLADASAKLPDLTRAGTVPPRPARPARVPR